MISLVPLFKLCIVKLNMYAVMTLYPPSTNVVSTTYKRCIYHLQTLYPPPTHVVSTTYKRCIHHLQTLYPPPTNAVSTTYKRCIHHIQTLYPPPTNAVMPSDKARVLYSSGIITQHHTNLIVKCIMIKHMVSAINLTCTCSIQTVVGYMFVYMGILFL